MIITFYHFRCKNIIISNKITTKRFENIYWHIDKIYIHHRCIHKHLITNKINHTLT